MIERKSVAIMSLILWIIIAGTFTLTYILSGAIWLAILGFLGWVGVIAAWETYKKGS
jgi:hypothetical protein